MSIKFENKNNINYIDRLLLLIECHIRCHCAARYENILDDVDGVYKTLNHPTPDLFYLSPMVGNCM